MIGKIKKYIPRKYKRDVNRWLNNCLDSARYFQVRQGGPANKCRHIIFVCKGNICRSVFAEHYFKQKLREKNIKVESCGIDVDQGDVSPLEAIQAAEKFGVNLRSHRSKGHGECEIERADLILGMEYGHYRKLIAAYPEKKASVFLLREFASWPDGCFCNIYDPFGQDSEEFDNCFRLIGKALDGLARQRFQS